MFQDFDETEVSFHLQNIQSQALSCFYRIDFIFTENKRLHNFKLWFRRSTFFDFASTIDSMEKVLSNPLRSKTWLYDCELYSRKSFVSMAAIIFEIRQFLVRKR